MHASTALSRVCIQRAVSLVGELENGQDLAIFQPEVRWNEDLAFDIGQSRHGSPPFPPVAIRPPTG